MSPQSPHASERPDRPVFLLGLAGTGVLALFVALLIVLYGNRAPERDDVEIANNLGPGGAWSDYLGNLWRPLNEHRIPLSELVRWGLLELTHDFRSAAWFQLAVVTSLSIVFLVLARRVRGQSAPVDLLFPLVWLGWGNAHNWLLGVQICVTLSVALSCAAVAALVWSPAPPSARRLAFVGAAATLSPYCGGFGLCQSPVWILWLVGAGVGLWRAGREHRAAALTACAWALAGSAAIALYFHEFVWPPARIEQPEIGKAVVTAGQFLLLGFGEAAAYFPWVSGLAMPILVSTGLGAALFAAVRRPGQRWVASGLVAGIAASVLLGLSIGWSRQDAWPIAGYAARYVLAPTTALVSAALAIVIFLPQRVATALLAGACGVALWLMPYNVVYGALWGRERHDLVSELSARAERGVPIPLLARDFGLQLYGNEENYAARLATLRSSGFPPFDRALAVPRGSMRVGVALGPEDLIESSGTTSVRVIQRQEMLLIPAPGRIVLAPRVDAVQIQGLVGVLPLAYGAFVPPDERTRGIEVFVEFVPAEGEPQELLHLSLDPVARLEDRRILPFDLQLPVDRKGSVVLRCESSSTPAFKYDGAVWAFTPPY